MINIYYIEVN